MGRLVAVVLALVISVSCAGCLGTPNTPPTVGGRAEPDADLIVGQEVAFVGNALDMDGSVVRYEWDFGDGTAPFVNATRPSTTHVFGQPGDFVAVFRACDEDGACGQAEVPITVDTGLTIAVNWTGENAYRISGPAALDAARLRVTLQLEGGTPAEFSVGSGLVSHGAGAYGASFPAASLERGRATTVTVFYNGSQVAVRTAVAQPFAGSSSDSDLIYNVTEEESGAFGIYKLTTVSTGQEVWLTAGGTISHSFNGTGSSSLTETSGGSRRTSNQTFTLLQWNEAWGRYEPTLRPIDYSASGTGLIEAVDANGLRTLVHLSHYEVSAVESNLTRLRASGAGAFEGGLGSTAGTATYDANSSGMTMALTGDGDTVLALRIDENVTYNGTLGGYPYSSLNVSQRLTAAHDRYFPADFWVAWNDTTQLNSTTLNTSGARFLDSDGDGNFNPDLRPSFPSDGRVFAGLVPAELLLGDRAEVVNGLGHRVVLEVYGRSPSVLDAAGYTAVAVTVASLHGHYEFAGDGTRTTLDLTVVAQGSHAMLWLSGNEHLVLGGRTFERHFTFHGRA